MKNWSDLPAELKLECIKRMRTKERWFFRQTAHTERELVDGAKLYLDSVQLSDHYLRITNGRENIELRFWGKKQLKKEDCLPLIIFVLRKLIADFMMIMIESVGFSKQITDKLPLSDVFEANRFLTQYDSFPWLRRLKKAEKISFVCKYMQFPDVLEFYGYKSVSNASFFQLQRVPAFQPLRTLIQQWIHDPPKMGTEFQIGFNRKIENIEFGSLDPESRISEDGDLEEIRIETNEVDKEIIVYRIKGMPHFVCIIIPSKLKRFEKLSRWTHIEIY